MCFRLARLLGFFKEKDTEKVCLPSFGDGLVPLSHAYDQQLSGLFDKLHLDVAALGCNPAIKNEVEHYVVSPIIDKVNMLNMNVLLHSRMFILHAMNENLSDKIQDNTNLRILEIGLSHHLLGILAYFGKDKKVEYFCVDEDIHAVDQYKKMYQEFDFTFINKNPEEYLTGPTRTFDIVLIHNANFMHLLKPVLSEFGFINTYEPPRFDKNFLDYGGSKKTN